jgi:hypothetical protein
MNTIYDTVKSGIQLKPAYRFIITVHWKSHNLTSTSFERAIEMLFTNISNEATGKRIPSQKQKEVFRPLSWWFS